MSGYCSNDGVGTTTPNDPNAALSLTATQQPDYARLREYAFLHDYMIISTVNDLKGILRDDSKIKRAYICNDVPLSNSYTGGGWRNRNKIEYIVIEDGQNRSNIPYSFFSNCRELKDVVLPDCIEKIGSFAFRGCTSLGTTELPKNLISIGSFAFSDCAAFNVEALPDGLTEIEEATFSGCTSLNIKKFPAYLTSIEKWGFNRCKSLAPDALPDCICYIGPFAFDSCTSLDIKTLPASLGYIGRGSFLDCTSLAIETLPDGLFFIAKQAFEGCSALTKLKVPSSVETIQHRSFMKSGLTMLDLSECNNLYVYDDYGNPYWYDAVFMIDCLFGLYYWHGDIQQQRRDNIRDNCEVRMPNGLGTWRFSSLDGEWHVPEL
jgi:hypothetical protein